MSSRQGHGRGAQVKLGEGHRETARGATGRSLLENLLAKRRYEARGLGADGDTADGSTWTGIEALDEVLTPGGRLDGYVPGEPQPGTGAIRGGAALAFGAGGTLTAVTAPTIGQMRGSSIVRTAAGGTLRALGQIAGSAEVGFAAGGTPRGLSALRGEAPVRFSAGGTMTGAGPMQGSASIVFQAGSGLYAGSALTFGAGGTLRGIGAMAGSAPIAFTASANPGAIARVAGSAAISFSASGTLSGIGDVVLTERSIVGRNGEAITLRDGHTIELRSENAEDLVGRDGQQIALRDGSIVQLRSIVGDEITDRDGQAIALRDGQTIALRVVPDAVEEPPPPPPPTDPEEPVVFPTTPYLLFEPTNAAAIVERQDGRTIHLRLVRPLYELTHYGRLSPRNTTATPENIYMSGGRPAEVFAFDAGHLAIAPRELTSEYDGKYEFIIYRNMTDGSFIEVNVVCTVAVDATVVDPQPTPTPSPRVVFEPFDYGRGTGMMVQTWRHDRFVYRPEGTVLLDGSDRILMPDGTYDIPGTSMMTRVAPNYERRGDFGFGYGLFEFRARFIGDGTGDRSGPAIILWPSDDVWPGQEWDLGEIMADGTFYHARHWKDPATGEDRNDIWAPKDQPAKFPGFNHRDWHVHALKHEPGRVTFLIDGTVLFTATQNLEPDFANGGVNHTMGLQNGSSQTGLECDWARWTPLALLPGGGGAGGGGNPEDAALTFIGDPVTILSSPVLMR